MVHYDQIKASNALLNNDNSPRISVFVGGTSGIGQLTVRALVAAQTTCTIYLIIRASSTSRTTAFISEMHTLNPNATIIPLTGEISLLSSVQTLCTAITSQTSHVDLLSLTAGYAPMSTRQTTSEGHEICQSLEFYSRMLFTTLLLPHLHRSPLGGRVVSVLSGGMERANSINVKDLALEKPGNFRFMTAQPQYGTMGSVYLDRLAAENQDVTFVHAWPGIVNTGNQHRGVQEGSWAAWLVWAVLSPIIALLTASDEVAGQRNLFIATSAAFGGKGVKWDGVVGKDARAGEDGARKGVFLVNYKCDCTPNQANMAVLRNTAQQAVWDHTQDVLKPYIGGE